MLQLRSELHAQLGWVPAANFDFARSLFSISLAEVEIFHVARSLPVVFQKEHERWQAVALMGPVMGVNLHVSAQGQWLSNYVPALFRVYPFRLDDSGQLGLWESYEPLHVLAEGVEPFYVDGALSSRLQQVFSFLKTVQLGIEKVHIILSQLEQAGVLVPWEVPGVEVIKPECALTSLFVIDRAQFARLEDGRIVELFRSGALGWLHAHLESLHHVKHFKAHHAKRDALKIERPRTPDKIEQVNDILSAIMEDLGDADL